MAFGTWDVNVNTSGMPQKVASAFGKLNEMVGAEYAMIAYLGSQVVNGTNHAVLAEQTVVTGKDVKNVVLVVFNEKPEGVTLVGIERIVESGAELGGTRVEAHTTIPEEAKVVFDEAFEGFVGSRVEPFAFLGTQMTKGANYIYAAEVTPVVADPKKTVTLVTVNTLTKKVGFVDLLTDKRDVASLGYAFNWLT